MNARFSAIAFAALLGSPMLLACAADAPLADGAASSSALEACTAPARYDAMFAIPGGCVVVRATGGEWRPQALFSDSSRNPDVDVDLLSCSFVWSEARPPSEAAMTTLVDHAKRAGGVAAPNCLGTPPRHLSTAVDNGPPPLTGHHGCDVCSDAVVFLAGGAIFGVVPPGRSYSRVAVNRSDGERVKLFLPAQTPGPFRATLPALPPGVRWIEGRLSPSE